MSSQPKQVKVLPSPSPAITVLMAAYNEQDYIESSIESILRQSFEDFELLVIDDGSQDNTPDILRKLSTQDSRIKVITQNNQGLTKSLNTGIALSNGRFIARQDADDVSLPPRLEKQFNIMHDSPQTVLCGTNCLNIDDGGHQSEWGWKSDELIQKTIKLYTPFAHSTVMMRTDAVREVNGYNKNYKTAQDTELWMRLSKKGHVTMLPDVLVHRTSHRKDAISSKRRYQQVKDGFTARWTHNKGIEKFYAFIITARIFILDLLSSTPLRRLKR